MTEKLKHTPGPWTSALRKNGMEYTIEIEADGVVVCQIDGDYSDFFPDEANARIITAAPEMYALLNRVVKAFEDTESSWANFEEQMMFFCVDAQKLIEKIKGE